MWNLAVFTLCILLRGVFSVKHPGTHPETPEIPKDIESVLTHLVQQMTRQMTSRHAKDMDDIKQQLVDLTSRHVKDMDDMKLQLTEQTIHHSKDMDEQANRHTHEIEEIQKQLTEQQEEVDGLRQHATHNARRLTQMSEQLEQLKQTKDMQDERIAELESHLVQPNGSEMSDDQELETPSERKSADIRNVEHTGRVSSDQTNIELKTTMRRLQRVVHDMLSRLHHAENTIHKMGLAGQVMFQASRDDTFTGSDTQDTIIPFDDVTLSVGGGYDGLTGVFTAPLSGYYLIGHRFMADSSCGSNFVSTRLYRNGILMTELSSTVQNGSAQSGLMLLSVGDTIWLSISSDVNHPCRTISDYSFNNFYGYLLYQTL